MKCPNRVLLIVAVVISVLLLVCLLLLPKDKGDTPNGQTTTPSSSVQIQPPTNPTDPTNPTAPTGPTTKPTTVPTTKPTTVDPTVADKGDTETETKKPDVKDPTQSDQVIGGDKDKNDATGKPTTAKPTTAPTTKPTTPPTVGDNPFAGDSDSKVEDTPVEDLIGNGEDRPGEGEHF